MNCNQVQAYFASRSDKKKSCIIISSFVSLFVGISVISVIILYPYPPKATSATKIFEKFGVPHNLWKTLISGQDDSTKIEEESNEKFNMNPYLKAKNYVAKHSEEKETDIRNYKWLKTEAKMKTDPGNLFRVIVNLSGVAQSVVHTAASHLVPNTFSPQTFGPPQLVPNNKQSRLIWSPWTNGPQENWSQKFASIFPIFLHLVVNL